MKSKSPNAKRHPQSREVLRDALSHLAFEVQHFRCFANMGHDPKLVLIPALNQALNTAMLVHLRVILTFFYPGPWKDGDISIYDFREHMPDIKEALPEKERDPEVDALLKHLHTLLAHLTNKRLVKRPEYHYYVGHFARVNELIDKFRDALPNDDKDFFIRRLRGYQTCPQLNNVSVTSTLTITGTSNNVR